MHELYLTSAVNKALAQEAHVQKAPQQCPSASPDPNRGSMHFSDRPLSGIPLLAYTLSHWSRFCVT